MPDPQTVAIVYNEDGSVHDLCWNWETAQNYALSTGARVEAVADDGGMSREQIQQLCDAERARYIDCFGPPTEPED